MSQKDQHATGRPSIQPIRMLSTSSVSVERHSVLSASTVGRGCGEKIGESRLILGSTMSTAIKASMSPSRGLRTSSPSGVRARGGVDDFADTVRLLLAEAEPEPGVDEHLISSWYEDIVAPSFVLDPRRGSSGVQVADDLRIFGRHSSGVHPDILPPDGFVARCRDEVPDESSAAQRRRAGRILSRPCRGDLLACRSRCLEAGREQRLCPTMLSVAGGEQAGCILHVLGRERNNPELHDRSLAETKLVGAVARRL